MNNFWRNTRTRTTYYIFGAISRAKIEQIKGRHTELCVVRKHAMKMEKGAKRTSSRQFGETAE